MKYELIVEDANVKNVNRNGVLLLYGFFHWENGGGSSLLLRSGVGVTARIRKSIVRGLLVDGRGGCGRRGRRRVSTRRRIVSSLKLHNEATNVAHFFVLLLLLLNFLARMIYYKLTITGTFFVIRKGIKTMHFRIMINLLGLHTPVCFSMLPIVLLLSPVVNFPLPATPIEEPHGFSRIILVPASGSGDGHWADGR